MVNLRAFVSGCDADDVPRTGPLLLDADQKTATQAELDDCQNRNGPPR
ncbi:hypothetical protein YSA_10809 [Pseudomonas putida ND6]|uniref:Uncharacterized protein n=1 Tax=Pseudomonas putida ND6 TaxID=231023 RepID=I3V4G0_PSEPU|nr:hypothetical protein YSA_10809 [Pseudomonas putida ND6]